MNIITKFFHELMNPHCQHCADAMEMLQEEKKYCKSCETLEMELATANKRIDLLLQNTIKRDEPITSGETKPPQIIQTMKYVPFNIRRQQLEQSSREEALALSKSAKPDSKIEEKIEKEINKLESDLGIDNGTRESA